MTQSYALVNGVDEEDNFVVTVHERANDILQVKFKIHNCTKFSVKVKEFVEHEASKLHYDVVEWR
jgi:hypothetical protein